MSAVKDAAKSALSAVKSFFGINSPSSVMRDQVGIQIGAGMAEGIEESQRQIREAMAGLNSEIEINPTFGGGSSGGIYNAPPVTVYVDATSELDGKQISRSTSRTQYRDSSSRTRALGVIPT